MAKVITVIVIVLVVGGGVWWWLASMNPSQSGVPSYGGAASSAQAPSAQNGAATALSANGSSNADLNQNLSQIDGQMNGFSSDSANVDQSMNDQPVSQSQL